ncbi:putative motility protein [Bradyrhizobium sp. LHD-71]|uniref:putative motility protein n=1 Tax=Bradyrhizobium sp. LHD-71 TaxID=3072141 RepID=UPI00280E7C06|nr:putative motility protein [Bradyrhizobium sp. LHD-71]MDQ8730609.1 putative motility protein [Bradyrhizobium sp. LHD-71]
MDVAALAASFLTMQAAATQQAVATRVMKMNLDAEAAVVQTLLQPQSSSANLAAGVGGNLDIAV